MGRLIDELKDAQYYAEQYMECLEDGEVNHANKYKSMAEDELKHASIIKDMMSFDIEMFNKRVSEIRHILQ